MYVHFFVPFDTRTDSTAYNFLQYAYNVLFKFIQIYSNLFNL